VENEEGQRRSTLSAGAAAVARYTCFVLLMRRVLPISAVLLALAILIWPSFTPEIKKAPANENSALEMLNPRYSGTDAKGSPFTVVATKAVQPSTTVDIIDLVDLVAELKGQDGSWSRLSATNGHYDKAKNYLELSGHVRVQNQQGYDMTTEFAYADLKEGRAWGEKPVAGSGPMGKINANGFQLQDGGKTIIFTGRPDLTLEGQKP